MHRRLTGVWATDISDLISVPITSNSYAKHGGMASDAKRDYNSWMVNLGTDIAEYTSIEAFFQQAPQRKTHRAAEELKSEFYAYGLDLYGRMPIACSGFNALASLGIANYNTKYKFNGGSQDKQRIGYRAGVGFSYRLYQQCFFPPDGPLQLCRNGQPGQPDGSYRRSALYFLRKIFRRKTLN